MMLIISDFNLNHFLPEHVAKAGPVIKSFKFSEVIIYNAYT